MKNELAEAKCRPCEKGIPALAPERARQLLADVDGWKMTGPRLEKGFTFKNFVAALQWVNRVGELAERENHHPDILMHDYKHVQISLWTHVANGLTENDFILAAKIDRL